MAKIRKGDIVQVISGKDKGATGSVLRIFAETDKVIVEGVARAIKHQKIGQNARGAKTGGIVHEEAAIHISNVMLVDSDTKKPTRVGFRKEKVEKTRSDGSTYSVERNVRISRRSGKDV